MTEKSWHWGGHYIGDSKYGHDDAYFQRVFQRIVSFDSRKQGVLHYPSNPNAGLEVSIAVGATSIDMEYGYAIIDGVFYQTDVGGNNLTVEGAGWHYIVLRKSVINQTVRAAILAPGDLIIPVPSTIQDHTWEIPVGMVHVSNAGLCDAITVIRDRIMLPVGAGCPDRQGGGDNWNAAGSTDYQASSVLEQSGSVSIYFGSSDTYVSADIVYPLPYRESPTVFTSIVSTASLTTMAGGIPTVGITNGGAFMQTGCTIMVRRRTTGTTGYVYVAWNSIGEAA